MFCPMMGDGTPRPCTTINRNVMVSHYVVAGSKNPLPLGMGSVNDEYLKDLLNAYMKKTMIKYFSTQQFA